MKQLLFILACLLITQISRGQQKAQQFAIKSGYAEYTLTGSTKGTKKLWWDDYGAKTRTETNSETVTKMFGIKSVDKTHSIEIIVKDKYWSANLLESTGSKGTLPYYNESRELFEDMSKEEQEEFANNLIESLGGEKLGNETIMGHRCEVIKVMGAKIWIYKGLTLKSEAKVLGIESNELASKFDAGKSISASKFTPPSDITYENIDQQTQGMFGGFADMANMDKTYEDDDSENMELVPTKYPYDLFLKKVNGFSHDGYKKMMAQSSDGTHNAMFMKGFGSTLMVAAVSSENGDMSEEGDFQIFNHKGKTCMYGAIDEDDDDVVLLVIEIPEYDTYITVGTSPKRTKQELLDLVDQFNF
ncbi:hypothetical protein [Carboxylicivirga sp. N1Y90]|uniref:hypothetical protein n=1 Tax=Carboxylicivirga fragile TaxID=3417571 RepID=UPI003D352A78|nr:hypothetical protein [Marinilabiliaceae bacterium N1Y90]